MVQNVRDKIQALNPDYTMILYDDADMDEFIRENFADRIYNCYRQLAVGAARADFWRYCILYINGGVYLDIDSAILRPLNELIRPGDQAIVTREGNPGIFNNWILIFEAEHPILWRAIENCCYNIEHRVSNYVGDVTGPHGPWTQAIHDIMLPLYGSGGGKSRNLYQETDTALNAALNSPTNSVRCRFYEIDMGDFAIYNHDAIDYIYQDQPHWRFQPSIFANV